MRVAIWILAACVLAAGSLSAQEQSRVLVLTDIGNEPDDSQSLVRFLLYANEFEVEGLIATTSTWLRDRINPQMIYERLDAYEKVRDNLLVHAEGYPTAQFLRERTKRGRPEYGMSAVGEGKDTEGSEWIIRVMDRDDPRPVWVTVWGGAADLAQAFWKVRRTRSADEVASFTRKLRVYSISDQDDAAPWIRRTFPEIFWIVSLHAFSRYELSTWSGISGDRHYSLEGPPDFTLVSNEWLAENIRQNRGPLGELYPWTKYIMEGDTPSFLYLIPNGLGVPERPEYGSWGGRYEKLEPDAGWYTDTTDTVIGAGGRMFRSNQATIWRWREAYQHDFAARMAWTGTGDYSKANHNPVVVLNGVPGKAPVEITAKSGEVVKLSAAGSKDPDGGRLFYRWFHYREAGGRGTPVIHIENDTDEEAFFVAPAVTTPRTLHVIVEVRDEGSPRLYAYRRALVTVSP